MDGHSACAASASDLNARRQTSLIVINGQSAWTAPKGLRLGLPLAALEKLNGRPFRMRGFGVRSERAPGNIADRDQRPVGLDGAERVAPGAAARRARKAQWTAIPHARLRRPI